MDHILKETLIRQIEVPSLIQEELDLFYTEEDLLLLTKQLDHTASCEEQSEGYHRGLFSKAEDGTIRLSSFSEFLEIRLIERPEALCLLSYEKKETLREWFFSAYYASRPELQTPVADHVLPLNEMLQVIDHEERDFYLCNCECRQFGGGCKKPVRTCISFHRGRNSFADRGVAEKITKETARQIILDADRAGLMHTINGMGYCQCCGDCCIMFRYTKEHHLAGIWPAAANRIFMDRDRCIGCGTCLERCHFDVFSRSEDEMIQCDSSSCVGCGLCANTCPTGALELLKHEQSK